MKFSDIKELEQKGLISVEQAQLICSQYSLQEGRKDYVMRLLSFLGGCLILTGLILMISANWQEIPSFIKTVLGLVIMLGLWVGGVWVKQKKNSPKIGEGLCFAGMGMWLANIGLYSQIYQVSSSAFQGTLLFFLGIVAIPFILKLKSVFFVVLGTSVVLLMTYLSEEQSGSYVYYLSPLLLSLVWIGLGVLFSQFKKGIFSQYAYMTLFMGFLFFFFMSVMSRFAQEGSHYYRQEGMLECLNGGGIEILGVLLFLWAMFGWDRASFLSGKKETRCLTWPLTLVLSALPLCFFITTFWVYFQEKETTALVEKGVVALSRFEAKNFFSALGFGTALVGMFAGAALSRVWLINLSVGALVVIVFVFVCDLVGEYGVPGVILVLLGLAFMALSVFVEKQRRKLVAQARVSHSN